MGKSNEKTSSIRSAKELSKESSEESNQTLTDKNNQMDLNMANQSTSDLNMANQSKSDLILNLSFNLKSDIINILVKYSAILSVQSFKATDRKKLFDSNTELIKRLSFLSSGNDNLRLVDESLIKDSSKNNGDLFYELNSTNRNDIIDILNRNFSSLFLSESSIFSKEKIIKENNEMIHLLINLVPKPFKSADKDDDIDEIFNRPSKRTKTDEPNTNLVEKVNKLENEIRQIKETIARSNNVNFEFELKGIRQFLESRQQVRSEYFYCLSIPWFLSLQSCNKVGEANYLEFFLETESEFDKDSNFAIETEFDLIIFHPHDPEKNKLEFISHLFTGKAGHGSDFISHDELVNYIKNDTIKLGIKMKAKAVYGFNCLDD